MLTRIAPFLFLLPAACSPVIADTDVDAKGEENGVDVGEEDDAADEDSAESEPGPDPGPSPADWAGDWTAFVELEPDAGGDWGSEDLSCEGTLNAYFDEDGTVSGDGICSVGGWAEAVLGFDGQVDEDGNLEGVLMFSQEWLGDAELDVDGRAEDDTEIDSAVEGSLVIGDWGYEIPVYGDMVLERE